MSDHAYEEAEERGISVFIINAVMQAPEQIVEAQSGQLIYQSKIDMSGKLYVVRVIVETTYPLMVVTVYRSSKIEKYGEKET